MVNHSKITRQAPSRFKLLIRRTNRHFYAQILDPSGRVISVVSTLSNNTESKTSLRAVINPIAAKVADLINKLGISDNLRLSCRPQRYAGTLKAFAGELRNSGVKF